MGRRRRIRQIGQYSMEKILLKRVSICLVLTTGLLFVLVTLLFHKVVLTACRL